MSQSSGQGTAIAREVAELEMLSRVSSPEALVRLSGGLHSDSAVVRQVAATSLGRLAAAEAIPELTEALHDPVSEVRRSVVWALGQVGDSRAAELLRGALEDTDPDVRRAALWALNQLEQSGAQPRPRTHVSRHRRRHRRRWLPWVLASVTLLFLAVAAAAALFWSRPLGPHLAELDGSVPAAPTEPGAQSAPTPLCGGPAVMTLMIIGLDSQGYYAGSADSIRVARIDFTAPSVILLGVPRDLWVTIPGLSQKNIYEDKLKMAYPYGNVDQVPGGGPSLLAQTLLLNLGLRVTNYAATDLTTFQDAIDDIGGIDIYLPKAVGDAKTDPPYFPAGWTHMDGATALSFARVRPDNSSDLARMDRQNQVIGALRAKLTSSEFLPRLPGLVDRLRGSVSMDLSPAEISSLVCIGQHLGQDQVSIVKIDKPMVLSVTDEFGHERLLPDPEAIRRFVHAFDAGDLASLRQMTKN